MQKFAGLFLSKPIFRQNKTVAFSLVKSERVNISCGKNTNIVPPFFLHHVSLGDYSYIARNANMTQVQIGKFCSIGPNCCAGLGIHPVNGVSTAPMFYSTAKQNGITLSSYNKVAEHKTIIIGNDVFIGANVTILDGVHIADGAVIGAGAVVTRDIPPYAIAVGVPARVVKYRFDKSTICKLIQSEWYNKEKNLTFVETDLFDVNAFLDKIQ